MSARTPRCCLLTGGSLFPGGVGNTWGDSAAFATLIDDITTKIFDRLPEWRARGW